MERTKLQIATFALILGTLGCPGALRAQGVAVDDWPRLERREKLREARAHFEAGASHYAERRFREAIREFGKSAQLMPSAELWFNIARAHESLGEHQQAIAHYELYLRDRVEASDAQEVRARIDDLRRAAERASRGDGDAQALLRIDVDRDGAIVMLDARSVGRSPLTELLEIAPGRHRLDVTHPGHLPFRAELDLQPGALTAAYVELTPREQREVRDGGAHLWTWIAAAGSGASLIASATVGALAMVAEDDGELAVARDRARVSDVLLGTGLALGVTALVLHAIEGGEGERR